MFEMKIILNGEEKFVKDEIVSYEDIATMVYGKPYGGVSVVYFSPKSSGARRQGILSPGQKISIQDGMIFNAMFTGNA